MKRTLIAIALLACASVAQAGQFRPIVIWCDHGVFVSGQGWCVRQPETTWDYFSFWMFHTWEGSGGSGAVRSGNDPVTGWSHGGGTLYPVRAL